MNDHIHPSDEYEGPPPLLKAVLLFGLIVTAGTLGLMFVEGWAFTKALFFTLISITTVGYGDEGLSEAGKPYALAVVMSGFGITTYTFSLLMQRAVANHSAGRIRMQVRIDRLKAHTIVCGYGRMGQTICDRLAFEHSPFVVIEGDHQAFDLALRNGCLALHGRAADDEILLQAGIERAAHIVSAVDDESENIAVTLSASELNPDAEIIARAERDSEVRKLRRAGAARTISPFRVGGLDVANTILQSTVSGLLDPGAENACPIELGQIPIFGGSELDGQELGRLGRERCGDVAFVALKSPGEAMQISPTGSTTLRSGDVLVVAGSTRDIREVLNLGAPQVADAGEGA